jgi:excinuclease ABC subunit C
MAIVSEKLQHLPDRPGVYIYSNAAGETIYVGKAKSLRSRVRSYFQPGAQHTPRVARMVTEVADLQFIVVDTEMEALLLEANLIKRERPRYNVILRDDKHFPYVKLSTRDPYPRASLVRRARLDGNLYAGPFLPAAHAWRSLKLIQRHFRLPTCKELFDGRRRPCLYYHLDQCLAPCAGKSEPEEYARTVADVRLFLEGRHKDLELSLEARMGQASQKREYEEAARLRDTLKTVRALAVRQRMSSVGLEEQDYLAHHARGEQLALQLFQVREGKLQARRQFTLEGVPFDAAPFYRTRGADAAAGNLPAAASRRVASRRALAQRQARRQGAAARAAPWREAQAAEPGRAKRQAGLRDPLPDRSHPRCGGVGGAG